MEKPKKQKTNKTFQLTVMIDEKHEDIIRRKCRRKGDLGKRVEHAIDLLDIEEQQT